MASLVVVSGAAAGDTIPLRSRTLVVGRAEGCPLQVMDARVSRKHVQIRRDPPDGPYHVLDLDSTNGTYLNDVRVRGDVTLRDGDIIRVGDTEIFFSAIDFPAGGVAFQRFHQYGERGRSTVQQSRLSA